VRRRATRLENQARCRLHRKAHRLEGDGRRSRSRMRDQQLSLLASVQDELRSDTGGIPSSGPCGESQISDASHGPFPVANRHRLWLLRSSAPVPLICEYRRCHPTQLATEHGATPAGPRCGAVNTPLPPPPEERRDSASHGLRVKSPGRASLVPNLRLFTRKRAQCVRIYR
jgi:hypothetical protein